MNILHIFPGKVWGGAEQYVLDLGRRLADEGHSVEYAARRSKAVANRLQSEGTECTFLRMGGVWDIASIRALAAMMQRTDVVHIHDTSFVPMVALARWAGGQQARHTRIILTRHIARSSRVMPWQRPWFTHVDSIIFVSHLAMRLWRSVNSWYPEERCHVVHNSIPYVPVTALHDEPMRSRFGIAPDTPLLVFTGRVRRSKGSEVILQALGSIRHLPFAMVFIGECKPKSHAQQLMRLAETLGIADRVHFYGFTSNVRELITQADIALAPSIVREACPLAPMEFMQAGKCVIATNNGAQPEYITDGQTGLLVPPADPQALAHAVEKAITDTALRAAIGKQAKEYFDSRMGYDSFARQVTGIYCTHNTTTNR